MTTIAALRRGLTAARPAAERDGRTGSEQSVRRPARWRARSGQFGRWVLPAVIWAAGQLLTLGVVERITAARHLHLSTELTSWDAALFVRLADHGYNWKTVPGGGISTAFFPGLPLLMRGLASATGLSTVVAGSVVSVLAALFFAFGLVRLVTAIGGSRRAGLILVALTATGPLSIVFLMAYTEALFCALAVWCLILLKERCWLAAGFASMAAGLVRPTGPALAAAVILAVIVELTRGRGRPRLILTAVLAPLGTVAYITVVGLAAGSPTAYFQAQSAGWDTRFDGGRGTATFVETALTGSPSVLDLAVVLVLVAALVLLVPLIQQRPGLPVLLYTVLVIALDAGSTGIMNSKVRLMIPAFTLLIPLARWLARQRPTVLILAGALLVGAGTWYSAYGLVLYGHAI